VHYETILQNMWRNGVRDLDEETFGRIAAAAGAFSERGAVEPQIIAPMGATEADDLIVPRGRAVGATGVGYRKSTRAKEIGDWAELEVVTFLRALGSCVDIVHRAAQRETPGWDIDYRDSGGGLHRVEVKGTVAAAFTTIDLTARELQAARQHGEGFWLFLVAHCLTDRPRIQRIRDPAARLASGAWTATPSLYSIALG
jgi:hypothetical protein